MSMNKLKYAKVLNKIVMIIPLELKSYEITFLKHWKKRALIQMMPWEILQMIRKISQLTLI